MLAVAAYLSVDDVEKQTKIHQRKEFILSRTAFFVYLFGIDIRSIR